jgi:hypothetical protein
LFFYQKLIRAKYYHTFFTHGFNRLIMLLDLNALPKLPAFRRLIKRQILLFPNSKSGKIITANLKPWSIKSTVEK